MRALSALSAICFLGAADAQTIAERVAKAPDGTVRMSFAAEPGLCGWNGSISRTAQWRDGDAGHGATSPDVEWERGCDEGPVRVVATVAGGRVTRVRAYVGGEWRPRAGVTDLGAVSAPRAADWLLGLAAGARGHDADDRGAADALFAATLADSADVHPRLLAIAKDERRPTRVRKQAIFWSARAAGEKVTAGLESFATSDTDRDVREQAIFALSQRPKDEGVPALIRIVRTNRDPQLRKKALFWLGQSGDPRAIALIEEILASR